MNDKLLALAERGRRLTSRQPQNRRTGDWYRLENATRDRAELHIYGIIGSDWGEDDVTAAAFVKDLGTITASTIDLHINSPGGLVWDGVAIYSALLNHEAKVDVSIDGIAASAASFVAMAGDSIVIEKPARMMIHDAHGLVMGNAADMREMADLYDELSDSIAAIYADRTGGKVDEWRAVMQRETWYTSEQAVAAGLADRVANAERAPAAIGRSQMIRARARVLTEGVRG